MDENGVKLTDTITPDGYYVNINGEKTSYMPGWFKDGDNWRYILKNGYYAQNGWLQDPATQKYYYFNMAAIMEADTTTPDGYYVGADGAWDGNASTKNTTEEKNLGPGVDKGWEPVDTGWKFKQEDGTYLTNSWRQDSNGKWYYLNEDGWMLKNANTPDGYHVDANGVWDGDAATESESEEAAE
jgi:glucan-binding YG repeat protein